MPEDGLSNEYKGGLMLLAIAIAIALNQRTDARVVQELREFELRLAATWQKGDCSAWGSMLAPEWSVIHITGDVITKEKALEMCRAPRSGMETVAIEDVAVRVFGNAAVVSGRTTASAGVGGSTVVLRFTDVFIRRKGQWRVVASQATELRGAKPPERQPSDRSRHARSRERRTGDEASHRAAPDGRRSDAARRG